MNRSAQGLYRPRRLRRSVLGPVVMVAWNGQNKFDLLAPAFVKTIFKFIGCALFVRQIAQRQHSDWDSMRLRIGNFLAEQMGRVLLSISVGRASFRVTWLAFGNVPSRQ